MAYHFGFIMEQTLGHVTHYRNMRSCIDAAPDVLATWHPLVFPPRGTLETLPPLRTNWSMRASWRAQRVMRTDPHASRPYDALFFHTQATALLSRGLMRHVPSVVSLDATPLNYDVVGQAYGHFRSHAAMEQIKRVLVMRSLHAATAFVTWCDWARRSLIDDYAIDPARITVIPPGVNPALWPSSTTREADGPVRLLFVGADFERKGGQRLLQAFQAGLNLHCVLHIVTRSRLPEMPHVHVYPSVAPNSALLRHLYATSDIFVLPTLADCFPLVIQEAMAAGLPVIASDVGAIGEAVIHGQTGLLVTPDDPRALKEAVEDLIYNPAKRQDMGTQGRAVAERDFNSATNARRILEIMRSIAGAAA